MAKRLTFAYFEICYLSESPAALRALADRHDISATITDASGFSESCRFHETRATELRAEADRLEARYNDGLDPGFTE